MARRYTEDEVAQIRRDAHLAGAARARRLAEHEREAQQRIGSQSEPRQTSQLGFLLSVPGFAQQAKRIPPVATLTGAAGVTPEGQIVCTCGGGVTDLELGSLVPCVAECGRYFTGTADKAFSFGPWPEDPLEGYELEAVGDNVIPLLRRPA